MAFKPGAEWTGNKAGRPKGAPDRVTELRAQVADLERQLADMRAALASATDIKALTALIDERLYKLGGIEAARLLGKPEPKD